MWSDTPQSWVLVQPCLFCVSCTSPGPLQSMEAVSIAVIGLRSEHCGELQTTTKLRRLQVFMAGSDYRGPHSVKHAAPAPQQPCQAQLRADATPASPFATEAQTGFPANTAANIGSQVLLLAPPCNSMVTCVFIAFLRSTLSLWFVRNYTSLTAAVTGHIWLAVQPSVNVGCGKLETSVHVVVRAVQVGVRPSVPSSSEHSAGMASAMGSSLYQSSSSRSSGGEPSPRYAPPHFPLPTLATAMSVP